MAETTQQSLPTPVQEPVASLIATTARMLGFADDLAFGCECADPSLQIEQWREEAVASPS